MAATAPTVPFIAGVRRTPAPASAAEPAWLATLRESALRRFEELGLPGRSVEAWRFTSLAPIAETEFALAAGDAAAAPRDVLEHLSFADCDRLVFVDGRYSAELSAVAELPEGAVIGSLAEVLATRPELVEPHLGRLATDDDHPFAALNTAMFADGAAIVLAPGTHLERPVHLLYLATGGTAPQASYPRTLVVAGEESRAAVVESYGGAAAARYLCAPVTEVVVGPGGEVDHVREQREGLEAMHVGVQHATQARGSRFTSHAVSLGAGLARLDIGHVLAGEGCRAVLNGLYLVAGAQHTDTHMTVEHVAPHCDSHELYKGVLDGTASAVFNGLIHVHPGAQQTNARQSNRNLLLAAGARANSNPQLEIFADDVKCTHGSTVGQLDDDAIFYLRSRGIGSEAARSILTYAFAAEVVEGITVEAVRRELQELLFNRLPQGEIVRQVV